MDTATGQALAEFLLGNKELADVVVRAALVATTIEAGKYSETRPKRERPRAVRREGRAVGTRRSDGSLPPDKRSGAADAEPSRQTAHYGTWPQLLHKHVLRFADLIAWTHEARRFGSRDSKSFNTAKGEGEGYGEVARYALHEPQLAPVDDVLLLRRFTATVLRWQSWPDPHWLAVGVWSLLRGYSVNPDRMSVITETILHGNRASKYTNEMLNKIKNRLRERFSHLGPDLADIGVDGLGYEYAPGSPEHEEVLSALSMMSPPDVPCFAESYATGGRGRFADHFGRMLNDPKYIISPKEGKGRWFSSMFRKTYPDDAVRRVMFQAHALLCWRCFESIAADYERKVSPRGGTPYRTREQGVRLRLPRFTLSQVSGEEVNR